MNVVVMGNFTNFCPDLSRNNRRIIDFEMDIGYN